MLIDAEAFQVLGQRRLDSLVKRGEVGTSVLLDLALKAMELLDVVDVLGDLHAVIVDLSVNSCALNNEALGITAISDKNGDKIEKHLIKYINILLNIYF